MSATVPPGLTLIIEQAVGYCGNSGTVKTEMFRISHYDPSMDKTIVIGYEKTLNGGNIIQMKPEEFDSLVHEKIINLMKEEEVNEEPPYL